jgi:hypothetical protein
VPKGTSRSGRTTAFGEINIPIGVLKKNISHTIGMIRHEQCLSARSATRIYPLQKIRSSLIKALCLDVVMQPVAAVQRHTKPNTLRDGKHAKQTVVWNPLWDIAPKGAYYKSKKICSLVTHIASRVPPRKIAHLLERLSICIWKVSRRHFDGLLRSIKAIIATSAESEEICFRKSPETLKRFESLIRNPYRKVRGKRFSRNRICRHDDDMAAMRVSTKVDLVRASLACTKCTVATCVAKWFTPYGVTAS